MKLPRWIQRGLLNQLVESDKPDEELVPIPCHCEPAAAHGPHYVPLRRLRKGGDLHGRVQLEDLEL